MNEVAPGKTNSRPMQWLTLKLIKICWAKKHVLNSILMYLFLCLGKTTKILFKACNKIVYYKSLSDSNWRENDYNEAYFYSNKSLCVGCGLHTLWREQNFALNNKHDQSLSSYVRLLFERDLYSTFQVIYMNVLYFCFNLDNL